MLKLYRILVAQQNTQSIFQYNSHSTLKEDYSKRTTNIYII